MPVYCAIIVQDVLRVYMKSFVVILMLLSFSFPVPSHALLPDTDRTLEKQLSPLDKAEKGDPQAQLQLGINYEKGDGVEVDFAKAAYWYQKG